MGAARRTERAAALAALLIGLLASPARAGQVRVNVGAGGQNFVPYAANVNLGDAVVWVWLTTNHTVTSWTLPGDSLAFFPDGAVFDSDPTRFGQPSSTRFSWKSDTLGHIPYVCVPHVDAMWGRVIVHDPQVEPAVAVANFRITEVQYNAALGLDLIEITNYGLADGDLGRFRLAATSVGTGVEIALNSFPVQAGGRMVIHTNTTGTNDATNYYTAGLGNLGNTAGSLALYLPHTIAPGNALTNDTMLVDFVQWGAGGQPNQATAVAAGMWGAGDFIPTMAAGHSIVYCANQALTHGVDRWAEVPVPNLGGTDDCTTRTGTGTWGRLKVIYRD